MWEYYTNTSNFNESQNIFCRVCLLLEKIEEKYNRKKIEKEKIKSEWKLH